MLPARDCLVLNGQRRIFLGMGGQCVTLSRHREGVARLFSTDASRFSSSLPRNRRIRRVAHLFAPVHREQVKNDGLVASHRAMISAGLIRQSCKGMYTLLPLAHTALSNISRIIDEEMECIGGQRVTLPCVQTRDLWETANRWTASGPELMRMKDRQGVDMCLAPTHEELITQLVAQERLSYKEFPLRLYQIGPKFRDEQRPRFGLMRAREFIMKDMYTFDLCKEHALATYKDVKEAYALIMQRLSLPYFMAEADTGNIGGTYSHEVQVIAQVGEDTVLRCSSCQYAANVERAFSIPKDQRPRGTSGAPRHKGSSVSSFNFSFEPTKHCDGGSEAGTRVVRAHLASHSSLNRDKLKRVVVAAAGEDGVLKQIDQGHEQPRVNDHVLQVRDVYCPELQGDHPSLSSSHLCGEIAADIRQAEEGDACGEDGCAGSLQAHRGIEVGHLFYLGTKYSKPFGATAIDSFGNPSLLQMGCYGLGVSRLLSAIVETCSGQNGFCWPVSVAPYAVLVVSLASAKDTALARTAESVYHRLEGTASLSGKVLLDDRKDAAGTKLSEATLFGFPYIIIVGKETKKTGRVELECRVTGSKTLLSPSELVNTLQSELE